MKAVFIWLLFSESCFLVSALLMAKRYAKNADSMRRQRDYWKAMVQRRFDIIPPLDPPVTKDGEL